MHIHRSKTTNNYFKDDYVLQEPNRAWAYSNSTLETLAGAGWLSSPARTPPPSPDSLPPRGKPQESTCPSPTDCTSRRSNLSKEHTRGFGNDCTTGPGCNNSGRISLLGW